ncbi:ArdC-like ssDNA-binding domain-containing protein [Streptosporangium sp. NPDC020072]|uniref:ArdC-like ssDNA-binding domain-containing protein n=1 Tax=Streptosporangium sp. NPDC020072 TaxID=3154788 RepID=UPI00341F0160
MKDRDTASRTAATEALHAYAVLCLSDPAELEQFRDIAASVGWKYDPASDDPGYSLQNVALLAAQRRPLTWCGGFDYWLTQGRCVAKGEKSLGTWRHIGRKKTDEEQAEEKKLTEEGWQSTKRGPRYYVKRGTFDIAQTVPGERCPHCGTTPTGPDDHTTQCPSDCVVFAPRPGGKPPRELVIELMQSQLKDTDEDEGGEK